MVFHLAAGFSKINSVIKQNIGTFNFQIWDNKQRGFKQEIPVLPQERKNYIQPELDQQRIPILQNRLKEHRMSDAN